MSKELRRSLLHFVPRIFLWLWVSAHYYSQSKPINNSWLACVTELSSLRNYSSTTISIGMYETKRPSFFFSRKAINHITIYFMFWVALGKLLLLQEYKIHLSPDLLIWLLSSFPFPAKLEPHSSLYNLQQQPFSHYWQS